MARRPRPPRSGPGGSAARRRRASKAYARGSNRERSSSGDGGASKDSRHALPRGGVMAVREADEELGVGAVEVGACRREAHDRVLAGEALGDLPRCDPLLTSAAAADGQPGSRTRFMRLLGPGGRSPDRSLSCISMRPRQPRRPALWPPTLGRPAGGRRGGRSAPGPASRREAPQGLLGRQPRRLLGDEGAARLDLRALPGVILTCAPRLEAGLAIADEPEGRRRLAEPRWQVNVLRPVEVGRRVALIELESALARERPVSSARSGRGVGAAAEPLGCCSSSLSGP